MIFREYNLYSFISDSLDIKICDLSLSTGHRENKTQTKWQAWAVTYQNYLKCENINIIPVRQIFAEIFFF